MTSPTSGIGPGAASAAAAAKSADTAKSQDLGDKDTFLKLLVAQLKYQDPSKPADSTQFLAQTAQFTQVEKLGNLVDMIQSQQMVGASSLVGKNVLYMDENGARLSGTITAAKLNGKNEPLLRVGNADVPMSKVMEIHQEGYATPAPAATPAAATPAAGTPAAGTPAASGAATPGPAASPTATPATKAPAADTPAPAAGTTAPASQTPQP